MTVIVLGSINIDLVVQVPRLPIKGETIIGKNFFTAAGGKAANQAVAIAKLGMPVHLVGQVGNDDFGQTLLKSLQASGVNTDSIVVNSSTYTGVASIVVNDRGENTIACAAGANSQIGEADLQRFTALLPEAKVVVLELGIPTSVIVAAAQLARAQGCTIILDPAPARCDLPAQLYSLVDIITPNEIEATQLVGFTVDCITTAKKAASLLHQWGVKNVIITLGNEGALCSTPEEIFIIPAIHVQVVDTVAAGDAFNGALTTALAMGKSLREAMHWGVVAGALAVTKSGAQSSLPNWDSFTALLSKTGPL